MRLLSGDTIRNRKTGEYGTALSGVKDDGHVTVKLPFWKAYSIVQWPASDCVHASQNAHGEPVE